MRKYRLTDETITVERNGMEVTLHRIEALRDFADVKVGDKGGFVEREANLSHEGDCWIYDDAEVYGNAEIYDNAKVHDSAWIYGYAKVFGYAKIYGNAEVSGSSKVCGDTMLGGNKAINNPINKQL